VEINDRTIYSEVTNPEQARELLANVSENGFSGNLNDLAREIGRGTDEILDILNYEEDFDEDLLIIINRIAEELDLKNGVREKGIH
jgi:hypothetical protein